MPPHPSHLPPEPFGLPVRSGRSWFDFLAAMAAIFISLVSLVVAVRGEATQRGLLAANSWPFVQLSKNLGPDKALLDVENAGVGPAKIMTFEVFYGGQLASNPHDLLRLCCEGQAAASGTDHEPHPDFTSGSVYDNVLRPGEHIVALEVRKSAAAPALFDKFVAAMPKLTFRGCYCSVLQECWLADLRSMEQKPVPSCPAPTHQFAVSIGDNP